MGELLIGEIVPWAAVVVLGVVFAAATWLMAREHTKQVRLLGRMRLAKSALGLPETEPPTLREKVEEAERVLGSIREFELSDRPAPIEKGPLTMTDWMRR